MLVLACAGAALTFADNLPVEVGEHANVRGVWRSFHAALKRLLVSDIIIRTCEGMGDIFIVHYVTDVTGVSLPQYGALVAMQMINSILVYIPPAKVADRVGRKPFVIATFACFALFPMSVILARGFVSLIPAFVIGGSREIGEPSRKAMIVDFAEPHLRARTVGLNYLVRRRTITPAAAFAGLLWKFEPRAPFVVACIIGISGTIVFAATVEERYAS